MPAVNTQTSANVESCARNSRTPGLSITVHTGSPRSTTPADRSILSARASAPIALAQSPPPDAPGSRAVVEATNGTGSPGEIASAPPRVPRVCAWRGSLCRVKRVVFATASGVDSSGGTPPFASWLYAQTRVSSRSRTTHRCLPDVSRRKRSPAVRAVGGSGVPSFDLRLASTRASSLGADPSSGAATRPATTTRPVHATAALSTRARGRRVDSSRSSSREGGDGGSFSVFSAFRAASTSRYSATTSSRESPAASPSAPSPAVSS
mmetsp:Transcript_14669/g.59921  ORF Transcript_14669/g.59921 Transcript_14669/m.59921 type:complete len:265 (+) Transcript_14669:557-1351(+)